MTGRIAFQGELGAYSHQACQQSRPDMEAVPSTTFEDVVDKVARGEVDLGMLAVE
ncbi:MAG: prephenate dehydratase, partial [Rhodobacterales bacterium]